MFINEMDQTLGALLPELIAFRRAVHQQPELGFQEKATTQRVKAMLESHGIGPTYIDEGLGLHFTIEGTQPGNTVLLRGDMDALPVEEDTDLPFRSKTRGVMHACGHDLNTTFLLGTAIVLMKHRDQLSGRVKFVFQCAEETLSGAKAALDAGVLDGIQPQYAFAFHAHPEHPVGKIGIRCGAAMAASDSLTLTIRGKGGHAAYPHLTVDPIGIAAHILLALQTQSIKWHHPADPLVITIGKIVAGEAANITPDVAHCQGTVRSFDPLLRKKLPALITQVCQLTANACHGDCDVQYQWGCPSIVVSEAMYRDVLAALTDTLGPAHIDPIQSPTMGSEDFGFFAEKMPGMQLRVGTRYEDPLSALPLHNARIKFSEDAIYWGVSAGCALALKLTQPQQGA